MSDQTPPAASSPTTGNTTRHARPPRFACSVCDRTYARLKHLQRHAQSHLPSAHHICPQCSRTFNRHDSFRRHQSACPARRVSSLTDGKVSSRACTQCARARQKCSHSAPCTRCLERGLECTYPAVPRVPESRHEDSARTSDRSQSQNSLWPSSVSHEQESLSEGMAGGGDAEDVTLWSTRETSSSHAEADKTNLNPLECLQGVPFEDPDVNFGADDGASTRSPKSVSNHFSTGLVRTTRDHWQSLTDIARTAQSQNVHVTEVLSNEEDGQRLHGTRASQLKEKGSMIMNQDSESHTLPDSSASSFHSPQNSTEASRSSSRHPRSAKYYAAGGGARDTIFSELQRFSVSSTTLPRSDPAIERQSFSFPDMPYYEIARNVDEENLVSETVYNRLCVLFQHHCNEGELFFVSYNSSNFASYNLIQSCVVEYFKNFHPIFAFIHRPTFPSEQDDILMVLATAAMGAFFIDSHQKVELLVAFHEFLRRALLTKEEALKRTFDKTSCLSFIQASLLCVTSMSQIGDALMLSHAPKSLNSLLDFCRERHFFLLTDQDVLANEQLQDWRIWAQKEECHRTAHCIWLLDGMLDHQQHRKSSLKLNDIQLPLPSANDLFNAKSANDWLVLAKDRRSPPSLFACLRSLETDLHTRYKLSDFSRILLVHGIFARCRQIKDDMRHLARFCEGGLTIGSVNGPFPQLSYCDLLGWPPWVEWRNQVCDCLDVLHTHANGVAAHSYGFEQHIILHLHLGRIIILTPYEEIRQMASFLSSTVLSHSEPFRSHRMTEREYSRTLETIRVWLKQDEYKMRLALLHSGALFWHVRRYSARSFYEPTAVFLASLVIWTYCLRTQFLKQIPTDPLVQPEVSIVTPKIKPEDEDGYGEENEVRRINIDRNLDDELVQSFVLGQEPVEVYMSRVGDLDMTEAPGKVLKEAARLLQLRCSAWPIYIQYHEWLTRLAEPSRQLRDSLARDTGP